MARFQSSDGPFDSVCRILIMAQVVQIVMKALSGKTITLVVEDFDAVASAKRRKVERKEGLPRHCQHLLILVHGGRELPDNGSLLYLCKEVLVGAPGSELPDNRSLKGCHVRNGNMLHLYLRLREMIQILVGTPYTMYQYGKGIFLGVGRRGTISTKRRIQQKTGVPPDQHQFTSLVSCKPLTDGKNTETSACLCLTICIKMLTGETFTVEVKTSEPIKKIKKKDPRKDRSPSRTAAADPCWRVDG